MATLRPLEIRFIEKVEVTEACWLFRGALSSNGYGRIGYKKRVLQAHRVSYEIHKGSIPDGLHIDHLCGNRICVNPDHLEAVSQRENNIRANAKRWSNETTCKRGHAWTDDNIIWQKQGAFKMCRTCHNAANKARRRGITKDEYFARLVGSVS